MLNINNAIKVEKVKYAASSRTVYTFICIECKKNTIRAETKYLSKHSGKCKYCAHKGTPYKSSYNHLKDGVRRTNLKRKKQKSFNLTFEEFLSFVEIKNCHYCNNPIDWVKHTGLGQHKYNLDRKDSNKGYSVDNCVVCCKQCNYMKGSEFTYEEFKEVTKLLDNMRNGNFIKK